VSKRWCREVRERTLEALRGDPTGHDVVCGSAAGLSVERRAECAALRNMTGDRSLRRLVSQEAFDYVSNKYGVPGFPHDRRAPGPAHPARLRTPRPPAVLSPPPQAPA